MLIMTTVTKIVTTFNPNVRSKYLAISGIVEEVGGSIFETSNRNTTIDRRTEIVSVIFSPKNV